jgi:hypothetical protein
MQGLIKNPYNKTLEALENAGLTSKTGTIVPVLGRRSDAFVPTKLFLLLFTGLTAEASALYAATSQMRRGTRAISSVGGHAIYSSVACR